MIKRSLNVFWKIVCHWIRSKYFKIVHTGDRKWAPIWGVWVCMELIASSRLHTKIVFLSVSRYLDSIGHCPDAKITVPDGGPHPTCTNILRTLDTVRARFAIWIQAAAANPTVAFQPFPTRFFSVSFVCSLRTFFFFASMLLCEYICSSPPGRAQFLFPVEEATRLHQRALTSHMRCGYFLNFNVYVIYSQSASPTTWW